MLLAEATKRWMETQAANRLAEAEAAKRLERKIRNVKAPAHDSSIKRVSSVTQIRDVSQSEPLSSGNPNDASGQPVSNAVAVDSVADGNSGSEGGPGGDRGGSSGVSRPQVMMTTMKVESHPQLPSLSRTILNGGNFLSSLRSS